MKFTRSFSKAMANEKCSKSDYIILKTLTLHQCRTCISTETDNAESHTCCHNQTLISEVKLSTAETFTNKQLSEVIESPPNKPMVYLRHVI